MLIFCSLVADTVLFNSSYNMNSFLSTIPSFLNQIPDNKPDGKQIVSDLMPKCQVLHFALQFPKAGLFSDVLRTDILHVAWPHRWYVCNSQHCPSLYCHCQVNKTCSVPDVLSTNCHNGIVISHSCKIRKERSIFTLL